MPADLEEDQAPVGEHEEPERPLVHRRAHVEHPLVGGQVSGQLGELRAPQTGEVGAHTRLLDVGPVTS